MMNTLQWDKLRERWNKQIRVIAFKCLKNGGLSYLSSNFTCIHKGAGRQFFNTLVLPYWYNNSGKCTFQNRDTLKWNTLDFNELEHVSSIT